MVNIRFVVNLVEFEDLFYIEMLVKWDDNVEIFFIEVVEQLRENVRIKSQNWVNIIENCIMKKSYSIVFYIKKFGDKIFF